MRDGFLWNRVHIQGKLGPSPSLLFPAALSTGRPRRNRRLGSYLGRLAYSSSRFVRRLNQFAFDSDLDLVAKNQTAVHHHVDLAQEVGAELPRPRQRSRLARMR